MNGIERFFGLSICLKPSKWQLRAHLLSKKHLTVQMLKAKIV